MTDDNSYRERPSRFPWPPVLWFGSMGCAWLAQRVWPLAWPGVDDTAARFIGWGMGVAGIVLFAWALRTLHAADTTVLPDKGADVLVTSGPFRRLRNPIYLAHVLVMLGLAEITKNPWFVAMAFVHAVAVTQLAIIPEERHLEARFGYDYLAYKAKSRRWI